MTPANLEIARGFAACERYRLLPGMLGDSIIQGRILTVDEEGNPASWAMMLGEHGERIGTAGDIHRRRLLRRTRPDIEDPAFPGLALFLVREAWKEPGIGIRQRTSGQWQVLRPGPERSICSADTEAGALLEALKAAP